MWLFYFLFWTAVRAREEPLYGKIGDKTLLTPDSVVKPIYTIAWKHGPSNAIEWFSYEDKTFSYRQFKDRGSLNTSTGALTITGLTPDDSGSYTVEINNKVTSKTELLVISPVSKPTVSERCTGTYCVFTCNGNTTGAEPVTHWWKSGDITWSSAKEHNITKENQEPWFNCIFKNPVSFNSSEKVFNPFIKKDWTWMYILIAVFGVILVGFIISIIYLMYKGRKRAAERKWQEFLQRWDKEILEQLKKGEAAVRSWQEHLEWKRKGVAERIWQEFKERWDKGAAERIWQEFKERWDKGEAAERKWQELLERWDKEFKERWDKVNAKISEINKISTQDLETAESPDTSNETGEAAERRWQEFKERWAEELLERLDEGAAERKWQEFKERWDKVISTISEVNETSTQDLETAESSDTSNETERPASLVVVQETSPQDKTSTGPPETSNETETTVLLPPVENPSTQDPISVVTQDPSNETEKSPMIPDNAETCC